MDKFFTGARKRLRQVVNLPVGDFLPQIGKICHAPIPGFFWRVRCQRSVLLAKPLENRVTIVGMPLLRIQHTHGTHQYLQIYGGSAYGS